MKRSNAPIFWSLFGAGGVLSALLAPVLIYITGVAVPTGSGIPPTALAYTRVLTFAQSLHGKAFLFAVIALFLWHAAHRIYHCLHDFGVHPGMATKVVLYGTAFAGSAATAWLLLTIGL
jgi:fumarate reductase subunit D